MVLTNETLEKGVEFYEKLCLDIDESGLPASTCAASLIAGLWYILPELQQNNGYTLDSFMEKIKEQFDKWDSKKELDK